MAVEWIEEKRTKLVEIYGKCIDAKEPVIKAFSVYLLRILNGLAQMECSKLYGYENQILGEAMKLFCEHYAEQVRNVLFLDLELSLEQRKRIVEDIEDAISRISTVYKNVIDSTSNSDRQMITSQAVETSIYDISPQLFATYSTILDTLVRLFGKEGVYAFLLHPSLKSYVEATSLFNRREKEGKVVLIYIPETEIEKIRQIPMYLLHEAFHVLTRDERDRKKRACNMELHMVNAISQSVFRDVNFDFVSPKDAEEIKNKLMERWFDTGKRIRELESIDESKRKFYSKNIIKEICDNWRIWLSEIFVTLGNDLCQVLAEIEYKQGTDPYEKLPFIEWNLQSNIVEILAHNRVKEYAHLYMTVYREAYADVACILMTGISPDVYEQAFRDSEIIDKDKGTKDIIRALRVHTVSKAVVACKDINHFKEWEDYSKNNDYAKRNSDKEKAAECTEKAIGTTEKRIQNDHIQILEDDLTSFEEIIGKGSQKLWEKIGREKSSFEKFRKIMGGMNLWDILNGKVNEDLQKLEA